MMPALSSFHFGAPALLALLPLAVASWWIIGGRGRAPGMLVSSVALVRNVGRPVRSKRGWNRNWIRGMAAALLLVALAGPQVERGLKPEETKAIDIMLLIDASRSMDTKDFESGNEKISRLDALRRVVARFVAARPQDRIGVIGFAEKPYLLCPLTLDHSWMMAALDNLETSLGTAMGSSIEAGVDLLRAGGNPSRAMILITDGINTSGSDPLKAAQFAADSGVRLYTIEAVSFDGIRTDRFEEHPLYAMAKKTDGQFFQAGNLSSLETIYGEIDRLERQQLRQLKSLRFTPLFPWFALAAGLMIVAETALGATRWLRVP